MTGGWRPELYGGETTAITRARVLERGTFTYDIEVNDDLITTVLLVGLDGYSSKNWTPFQSWIRQNHPDHYGVMCDGPSAIAVSDESLALWESRIAEYIGQPADGPETVAAVTDACEAWSAGDVDGYIDALAGPSNWWERIPADMAIVLDYVEEFVAQSDVYPITP